MLGIKLWGFFCMSMNESQKIKSKVKNNREESNHPRFAVFVSWIEIKLLEPNYKTCYH